MKLNDIPFKTTFVALGATWLLTACGLGGPYPGMPELLPANSIPVYRGPVAPPQVAYRIDENRHFEIVPREAAACSFAGLYYTDKARGIHSYIYAWQSGYNLRTSFIIDAENDNYLIAPISQGNTDCSSGGGGCGGSTLPYSTDGGRTWERATPGAYGGYAAYMSGEQVYTSGMRAKLSELAKGPKAWTDDLLSNFPPPRKAPLDRKFHCTANGKE